MIHKGRKVLDEPMSGLRRQFDTRTILFEPLDAGAAISRLDHVAGVETVKKSDQGISIRLAAGTDPAQAMRDVAATLTPARIELARIRLEDVFVRLVTQGGESQEAERALRTHLQGQGVIGSPS
jgi:ABC-type uncharacterized transport system ATPase subunit